MTKQTTKNQPLEGENQYPETLHYILKCPLFFHLKTTSHANKQQNKSMTQIRGEKVVIEIAYEGDQKV